MSLFGDLDIASAPVRIGAEAVKTVASVAEVITEPVADLTNEITGEICDGLKSLRK